MSIYTVCVCVCARAHAHGYLYYVCIIIKNALCLYLDKKN